MPSYVVDVRWLAGLLVRDRGQGALGDTKPRDEREVVRLEIGEAVSWFGATERGPQLQP